MKYIWYSPQKSKYPLCIISEKWPLLVQPSAQSKKFVISYETLLLNAEPNLLDINQNHTVSIERGSTQSLIINTNVKYRLVSLSLESCIELPMIKVVTMAINLNDL